MRQASAQKARIPFYRNPAVRGIAAQLVVLAIVIWALATIFSNTIHNLRLRGIQTGFGDEWIQLGATAEHAVDGSLSERTMAMRHSYIGMPASYHGNLTETQEDLNKWCERVHRAHIRLNCHANGDIAIDRTELEDARWFDRDEVVTMLLRKHSYGLLTPPPVAIAHHIIRAWIDDEVSFG